MQPTPFLCPTVIFGASGIASGNILLIWHNLLLCTTFYRFGQHSVKNDFRDLKIFGYVP